MITRFSSFLMLLAVFACADIFAQDYSNPVGYMNYFTEEFDKVAKDTWAYTSAVARGRGARKVESKRTELMQTTRSAKSRIERTKDYEGDISLRDSLVSYLELSYIVLDEDYEKIMDMEEVAEQSYDDMEALILAREQANDKLDRAGKRMVASQKKFAESHGIELDEALQDEVYVKLEKAAEVFDYYNEVYLIFFKSHKQEGYLVDAMNRADVNGMEQNNSALLAASTEGLSKLKEYKAYGSDPQLRIASERMLEFHKDEAEEKMPVIINFYVQQENFEKVRTSFEAIKKTQRTQEDVDTYNNALEKYNSAVAEYNSINQGLNSERDELFQKWNEASSKFLDRHVPH